MPFRIRDDARQWFREVRDKGFSTDFDTYYFCFMAGIATGRKETKPTASTTEFIDYFPDRYKSRGKLLVALFLSQELKEMGVEMNEKKAVHSTISPLIKPDSPNYLSEEGIKLFNGYAHGGFDTLLDWFDDKPRSLETFLRAYKKKIDNALMK